jgi:NAD(P)-dependent dehydrogenase (short-subunit alcohol dehydrogenase family)
MTMGLLAGKTAVITGGSTGIGLATAQRFIDEGAEVFITGRRQAELDIAVKQLGVHAVGVQGDVSKAEDLDRLYAAVAERGKQIDVLFANAAIIDVAPIGQITEQQLDQLLAVDFKGVVFTVQKALPLLRDGASVILNSSNTGSRGTDGIGVYAAIKAALRSLARTWASELRGRRIRVNVVSPGATDTPGIETLAGLLFAGPDAVSQFKELQNNVVPLGRLAEPVEVANAVLFLASDLSSYTTGAEIPVDGGVNQI